MAAVLRQRDYVVGASVWSYNDYRSRFPGTPPDGYRPWGVVDRYRTPRPMYHALRDEFSPAELSGTVEEVSETASGGFIRSRVRVAARDDFPRHTLRRYTLRYTLLDAEGAVLDASEQQIAELRPGQEAMLTFETPAARAASPDRVRVELVRPTGFSVIDATFQLPKRAE